MTEKGYLASLEEQMRFLNECDYVIIYLDENGEERTLHVREADLEWNVKQYLPAKNYPVLAVSKLEKEKVAEIAKAITDKMALRLYKYVHEVTK